MRNQIPSWVRIPVIFFIIVGIVEFFVDSGKQPAFIEQPIILLFLVLVLFILIATDAIVGSLDNILYQSLDEKGREKYDAKVIEKSKFLTWVEATYEKALGAKPMQEEHEIILDHSYDGIRELDNDLPPWWKYSFYASIIFAFVYMIKYHVFNGENQYMELEAEYAQAKIDIENYKKTAKDLVDFNTVELLTDASDLSNGKRIYMENCVACHKADGGGGIGPNLADEHWILGGGIKNVFKTVSEGGRAGKGMIAWKQSLKPAEIAQVSSYVLQFQGTNPPDAKAAEGDIWVEENN
ncbi:cbb3-type cytochrome c oxidase N-terminal domain-containing protein [Oceanihabitans sediminis]|uniref:Cytochrome C oxidase subunit III n=1 Tax=Oceanihabitans sediminis TaxID=1812012 RepID=A0A368P3F8_9FLAO|nr:cbb3-type cytochrome c oxidase N-terminal domain-containing protein [Oceanihabitans sediminis]MDX1278265.1 cbb3-type cytochrome c oxidase N-terminal domain-containing protein [Oceanihabitans sediminis]MDX1774591.1 cbb3-type cytochrome c oxidase N-terminal domain-containing protein [Oceanihabitans sediminis]RBP29012.1 cytochrome c oxidase cbb3-type subunit 3 [Oceanihabitans sediminis]RCU57058.1 cytochrome C oxidase subunit III [Oceanihabitans sediminis]